MVYEEKAAELGPGTAKAENMGAAALWASLSALVLIALYVRHSHASLDGDFQGWGSASCMLMARGFNHLGALRMHFVPFQNNLPLGKDPDVYLHWPPLFPLLLAWCLRSFGDTVFTGRLLVLAINLVSGALVAGIAGRLFSARIGWLSCFFFFTSRAVFVGNAALLQQPLAMMFALLLVFCFLHAVSPRPGEEASPRAAWWAAASVSATVLMVFSAWDPIFTPFALLGTAIWLRQGRAAWLAAACCAAAALAFAAVELDYVLSYPKLFANQFATIAYRAGLHFRADTSMRLPTFVDAAVFDQHFSIAAGWWRALRFADQYLSSLSLALLVLFVARWWGDGGQRVRAAASPGLTWVLGGLLLPGLLWYGAMRNYVAIHPFPLILFAPATAIASGFFLDGLWTWWGEAPGRPAERVAALTLVPLMLLLPLLIEYRDAAVLPPAEFADLSQLIGERTPASAVVLTPADSLVVTLYSGRHVVRGIRQEDWLAEALAQAHVDFPGAPVYLALRAGDATGHEGLLRGLTLRAQRGDSLLYVLPSE